MGQCGLIIINLVGKPMPQTTTMTGDGKHTHKNGDDLGRVYAIGFTTLYPQNCHLNKEMMINPIYFGNSLFFRQTLLG
jgi:hypothetical protein